MSYNSWESIPVPLLLLKYSCALRAFRMLTMILRTRCLTIRLRTRSVVDEDDLSPQKSRPCNHIVSIESEIKTQNIP